MSPDFVEHKIEPIDAPVDMGDCLEILEIVSSLHTRLAKEHAEMHNDLISLIEDVEYLFETGMKDTPNPVPDACKAWWRFYTTMVKASYNKAKSKREKWTTV